MPVTISGTDGISIDGDPVATDADLSALVTGKVLQYVEATDSTDRTGSGTYDANISVTITPISATSKLLIEWTARFNDSGGSPAIDAGGHIADSSNNILAGSNVQTYVYSGSTDGQVITRASLLCRAFVDAVDTTTRTYKGRGESGCDIQNATQMGRMIVWEIAA